MRSSRPRAGSCSSWRRFAACPTGRISTPCSSRATAKKRPRTPGQSAELIGASDDRERPLDILADRPRRLLIVQWADGHESFYDFELLRWSCPCAECAGEAGRPGRVGAPPELTAAPVSLVRNGAFCPLRLRPTP